jgi:D-cysteine desulfhydrase
MAIVTHLHERFPELRRTLPRLPLCTLPTPVRSIPELGADVWVKDDSGTAVLHGGNKTRKLEWTLADAKRRRFGSVMTFGGLATNHGLATALYAREVGLDCVLVLVDQPVDEHVTAQLERHRASGAHVVVTHTIPRTYAAVPWLLVRHAQLRPPRPPYVLPPGGSSALGAVGFVEAALELAAQVQAGELPEPARVVMALGTGGTAAGLLLGLRIAGLRTRVVAVLVNDQLALSEASIVRLARKTRDLLARRGAPVGDLVLDERDVTVPRGFLGAGYGYRTPEGERAMAVGTDAGLELEHVYTAKTVAAVLAGAAGRDGPTLYWHTHTHRV